MQGAFSVKGMNGLPGKLPCNSNTPLIWAAGPSARQKIYGIPHNHPTSRVNVLAKLALDVSFLVLCVESVRYLSLQEVNDMLKSKAAMKKWLFNGCTDEYEKKEMQKWINAKGIEAVYAIVSDLFGYSWEESSS